MLEIDCDGHRSRPAAGVRRSAGVAEALRSPHVNLLGVMTHAGSSYNCRSVEAIRAVAEQERAGAVHAAARLREAGFRVRRERRVDADGDVCRRPDRRDRGACRRVRVLRPGDGGARRLCRRRHRVVGADVRDRPPAGQRLDDRRCRLDGDVARSRHVVSGVGSGLRAGVRRRRPRACRLHRQRREPGARHHLPSRRRSGAYARRAGRHAAAHSSESRLRDRCPAQCLPRARGRR